VKGKRSFGRQPHLYGGEREHGGGPHESVTDTDIEPDRWEHGMALWSPTLISVAHGHGRCLNTDLGHCSNGLAQSNCDGKSIFQLSKPQLICKIQNALFWCSKICQTLHECRMTHYEQLSFSKHI
jgi:hypothetical protein